METYFSPGVTSVAKFIEGTYQNDDYGYFVQTTIVYFWIFASLENWLTSTTFFLQA